MTNATSLYVHVPFCRHLCNYCDFYKVKHSNSAELERFSQFLTSSWLHHKNLLTEQAVVIKSWETIYLGGGTPSLWGEKGALDFANLIKEIPTTNNCEFTMEVDPGTWTENLLKSWQDIGLNRISVGTQALDEKFLNILDRSHSLDESLNFLNFLNQHHWNFSLDFLLGAPFSIENKRDLKREIDLLLSYGPKHISLYILNARSKYPHLSAIPHDDYVRDEYLFVSDYLGSKGFIHYEVSNFALPGFESKHNQKYWRSETVLGLGPSAVGYLNLRSDFALRYKWKVSQPTFQLEELKTEEIELEKMYLSLRTLEGMPLNKLPSQVTSSWISQGLAHISGERLILTPKGWVILDSLMDDIFRAS